MKNILTISVLVLGILFSAAFGSFQVFANRCGDVTKEVLRLHIPANSDSEEDQQIKLSLRDFVLERFGGELSDCGTLEIAERRAEELIPEIERECTEFLLDNGFSYGAKAELTTMYFTTREYDRLILPAGEYRALRITLGSGEGHNWWCVIFPQLCLPAVSEPISADENAENVLDAFGKPQKITVKFAVFEWFQSIFG
ncbi:MAG: stage II sporulation protein R [Ruminococcaceae bacterium]|nr:stage II sporulation protein R [Oscillospiraceae bacterium]